MRLSFPRSRRSASAPDALSPHCANCGNPLAVGQDWCLDCGTAVRGRLGSGPGIGSSIGVVGLTLLLVLGAVAAAYAALNSDSNKAAKAPPALVATAPVAPDVGTTTPGVSAGTPVVVGATGATGTTAAPITPSTAVPLPTLPKIPGVTATPPVASPTTTPPVAAPQTTTPPVTTTPKTATTPTATTPTVTTPTATTPTATTPTTTSAHAILLDTDAATTYNPYSLPASSFTDPSHAIDGDPDTAWTYQLDPTDAGKTLVGLAIDMKTPQAARAVKITTLSPGMTVEFYGAAGSTEPVSITDPGWVHLANRSAIKPSTTVVLKTQGKSFRYLLIWITHAPAGVTAGSVGISEVSVTS
ncbi:MAG TPA: hypothetical protein VG165_09270 [Solirubrobacteraceae bacterium]|jgi:hypothetical protein|nr:hypothetical protein [Solirubrobacteraceae bacterium]